LAKGELGERHTGASVRFPSESAGENFRRKTPGKKSGERRHQGGKQGKSREEGKRRFVVGVPSGGREGAPPRQKCVAR